MRNFEDLQIAVAGTGYVGLSIATLLAQHHKVTAVDIIPEKVEKINNRISPIQDEYIEKYFAEKELNLTADNLWPSRIIVGYPKMMSEEWEEENEAIRKIQGNHMEESAEIFAKLLQESAIKENIDTLFMGLKELRYTPY